MPRLTLLFPFIFFSYNLFSQAENYETDRPGKTNTPSTALKKYFQFETGFIKQTEKGTAGLKDFYFQHPYLLSKYGIGSRLELRAVIEWASIYVENVNGITKETGINSARLAGKFNCLKAKGLRPKISVIAHYDFRSLHSVYKGRDSIDGANFRFALRHNFS